MTSKPPLKNILQGILHTESESKQNHERAGNPNHRRRKGRKVESNIYLATHNQTLNQQRKIHDRDHHISINTNTEH
jgi:hypothetical protein